MQRINSCTYLVLPPALDYLDRPLSNYLLGHRSRIIHSIVIKKGHRERGFRIVY